MTGLYLSKATIRGLEGEALQEKLSQAGLSESVRDSIRDKCINGNVLAMMEETDVQEEFKEDPVETRVCLRAFLRTLNAGYDSDETQDRSTENQDNHNHQAPVVQKNAGNTSDHALIDIQSQSTECMETETDFSDEDKLYKEFKFPMPLSVKKKLEQGQKLDEQENKKLVRESLACLEAIVGDEPTKNQLKIAAKKICDVIPQLRDPKPPSFPEKKEFPYWSTVRFMMGKRKLNAKAYFNRNNPKKTKKTGTAVELSEKEYEAMSAELLKESRKRKPNERALEKMQQLTFKKRSNTIVEDDLDMYHISSDFPFLKSDLVIRNELHLHVCKLQKDKSADCPTLQTYGNNWGEILKRSLIKEHELSGESFDFEIIWKHCDLILFPEDELSGHILEKINVKFPKCEPIIYFLEDTSLDVVGFCKQIKLKEWPWLLCYQEDNESYRQIFIVVDSKILLEIQEADENASFTTSLLTLLGVYYAFNIEYKASQKLLFTFLEEFILGIKPCRQTLRYRKAVQATIA